METLWQDLRYGARMLLKSPGFTAIAVITLALGVGANTAIFSIINAVLLKPLPYREPERLVKVVQSNTTLGKFARSSLWPYPRYEALRDQNESFEGVAAYCKRAFNLTGAGEPEHLSVEFVSASYLPLLGVEAAVGRTFAPEEDATPGSHPVALISHGLWQRRFGGDPALVGKSIELDRQSLIVVGVLPPGFKGQSGTAEVWLPMMMVAKLLHPVLLTQPRNYWIEVIARLKSGVMREQAAQEMAALTERLEQLFPGPTAARPSGSGKEVITPVPLRDAQVDPAVSRSFLILLGAVGFVLLIACANVANLMLARAAARRKEFAVRLALGARRGRIVRQLLTESMMLALLGGGLGVLVALWGIDLLNASRPSDNVRFWSQYARTFDFFTVRLDGPVLAFNFLLAAVTGLLFGLLPAWQASRPDVNKTLKDATGEGGVLSRRWNARSLLVVAELALSLVLLTGAGLMVNSLIRLNAVNLGFAPEGVLTMRVQSRGAQTDFYRQLLERVEALPGVESASVSNSVPLTGIAGLTPLEIEGRPETDAGPPTFVGIHTISADHFGTLGMTLIRGRNFTNQDRAGAPRVAVINQAAAERLWPGQDPLGQRIKLGFIAVYPNAEDWVEVVGVVNDVKYGGVQEPSEPDVYLSYLQPIETPTWLVVRADGDREGLVAAIRREVRALDPNMPVYNIKTMGERSAEVTSSARFGALALALFAGLALALAAIGIYGVISYAVARRTREVGIRMALGAQAGDIFRLILRQGLGFIAAGLIVGLIAAYATSRVLASQLYGVSATDPLTFALVALPLAAIALLACYVPARRATKVDPMAALRHE